MLPWLHTKLWEYFDIFLICAVKILLGEVKHYCPWYGLEAEIFYPLFHNEILLNHTKQGV